MLESQLVLAHLTEDGANVKMDICGVQNLQAIVHGLVTVMKIIIFDFKSFF